jgi:signal transduction histidine kinase
LLSNAIKYNRAGGRVDIRLAEHEKRGWLAVEDTGQGIAAEQIQHLFKPFDRLGAEKGKVPGRGLGLAITKRLAEAMGGHIAVQSEPGVSTTFQLNLPKGTMVTQE